MLLTLLVSGDISADKDDDISFYIYVRLLFYLICCHYRTLACALE